MEEQYLDLLKKAHYDQLSSDEKESIKELCSNQAEYESVKRLMVDIDQIEYVSDDFNIEKVKAQLDAEFIELHSAKEGGGWLSFLFPPLKPIFKRPGFQYAMVLVLFFGSFLILELLDFSQDDSIQLAENTNPELEEKEEGASASAELNTLSKDLEHLDYKNIEEEDFSLPSLTLKELPSQPEESNPIDVDILEDARDFIASRDESNIEVVVSSLNSEVIFDDNSEVVSKFLIPTIDENPDLLEGLFVTF